MEMKKFTNCEEGELISFIKQDNKTIKIRFITESDYTTKVYYDVIKRNDGVSAFGLNMFRQVSSPYASEPSMFRKSEIPVSATNHDYFDRQSNR